MDSEIKLLVHVESLFTLLYTLFYCIRCVYVVVHFCLCLRIMARIKRIIGAGGRIIRRNAKNCRIE